jgi:hypothetical protein
MAGSPPCGVVWRPKFQFFSRFRINFCKFLLSSNSTCPWPPPEIIKNRLLGAPGVDFIDFARHLWFHFRRLFVKHQNFLNCNKHRTIPRFPPFEFFIWVSKTYRKLTCVRDRVGDVILFSFMLIFCEKYAFGTPSEYGGIQNDGTNRPCRAKDFEIWPIRGPNWCPRARIKRRRLNFGCFSRISVPFKLSWSWFSKELLHQFAMRLHTTETVQDFNLAPLTRLGDPCVGTGVCICMLWKLRQWTDLNMI